MTQEQKLQMYAAYLPYNIYVSQPRHGIDEAYLFYGLRYNSWAKEWTAFIDDSRHGDYQQVYIKGIKPILRPMYDLTKEIVHEGYNEGKPFVPIQELNDQCAIYRNDLYMDRNNIVINPVNESGGTVHWNLLTMPFDAIQLLLKWHFNIFNLPETEYIVKE